MSSWMALTLRAKRSSDYEWTDAHGEAGRWPAVYDLVASFEGDSRISAWTVWEGHVYVCPAFGAHSWHSWGRTRSMLDDYAVMLEDAVALAANDTSDTGEARYYATPGTRATDEYVEEAATDGEVSGRKAMAVLTARHGIICRDPLHTQPGALDDWVCGKGTDRLGDDADPNPEQDRDATTGEP